MIEIQREIRKNTPMPFIFDRQFSLGLMEDDSLEMENSPNKLDMSDIAPNSSKKESGKKQRIKNLGKEKIDFSFGYVRFRNGT